MRFLARFKLIVFFAAELFFFAGYAQEPPWQLKKFENGVAVYSRQAKNSNFKELKAEVYLQTSLNSIVALLEDRAAFPEWVYKCSNSHIIKQVTENEMYCYQYVEAPWPVEDRDICIHIYIEQNPKTKEVIQTATCVPNYIPSVKNVVRVKEFKAKWILTPMANGQVKCYYELLVDPGGNVPAWLVNLAALDGPYETTWNMKTQVLKAKYQKAKLNHIQEWNGE
jgi:START domain